MTSIHQNPNKRGFTEAEILSRKSGLPDSRNFVKVRCPNGSAHKHDDRNPSGSYSLSTGFYRCHVCSTRGFASDRNHPDFVPAGKTQTKTQTKPKGRKTTFHYNDHQRVIRVDHDDGTKDFRPYHLSGSRWRVGKGDRPWGLYSKGAGIEEASSIVLVEGEKCVEALANALGKVPAMTVITSSSGSNSASRTDWSQAIEAIGRGARLTVIPDTDDPGNRYVVEACWAMGLAGKTVSRVDLPGSDGFDIADWLLSGKTIAELAPCTNDWIVPGRETETTETRLLNDLSESGFSQALEHHHIHVRLNTRTQEREVREGEGTWNPPSRYWFDALSQRIYETCQHKDSRGKESPARFSVTKASGFLSALASENPVDPFWLWLSGIEWDGQSRIYDVAREALDCDDDLAGKALAMLLKALVERARPDGAPVDFHLFPILSDPREGSGKSTN